MKRNNKKLIILYLAEIYRLLNFVISRTNAVREGLWGASVNQLNSLSNSGSVNVAAQPRSGPPTLHHNQ